MCIYIYVMPMRTVISTIYVVCIEMEVDHAFIKKNKKTTTTDILFLGVCRNNIFKNKDFHSPTFITFRPILSLVHHRLSH